MNLVKLTDSTCVNPKHIVYVNLEYKDGKYLTTIRFRARYACLTWTHNTNEFYNTVTNLLLNIDESNGGKSDSVEEII